MNYISEYIQALLELKEAVMNIRRNIERQEKANAELVDGWNEFAASFNKFLHRNPQTKELKGIPLNTFCECKKCGNQILCEHSSREPHIESMCGNCAT